MRTRKKLLALSTALLLAACGGGGKNPIATQIAQLESCLGTGIDELLGSLGGLAALIVVASDPDRADELGLSWTPVSATVYDFTLPVDLDGDETNDGELSGTVTFDRDPTGGLMLEDSFRVTWDLTGVAGATGEGDLHLQLGAEGLDLWGEIEFAAASGDCDFRYAVDELAPISLTIDGVWPPTPTATFPFGSFTMHFIGGGRLYVRSGDDTLIGDAAFPANANTLTVTQIQTEIAGVPGTLPDQTFSLAPSNNPVPALAGWVGTWSVTSSNTSFITQNSFDRSETWTISVRNADSLDVVVVDTSAGPKHPTLNFVLVLEPGSTTKGAYIVQTVDSARFEEGQGAASVEDRGTLELFTAAPPVRLIKVSSYGPAGFNQTNVEGRSSFSSQTKSP